MSLDQNPKNSVNDSTARTGDTKPPTKNDINLVSLCLDNQPEKPSDKQQPFRPQLPLPEAIQGRNPSSVENIDGIITRTWRGNDGQITYQHRDLGHGAEALAQNINGHLLTVTLLEAQVPRGLSECTRNRIQFHYNQPQDGSQPQCIRATITNTATNESIEYRVGTNNVTNIRAIGGTTSGTPGYEITQSNDRGYRGTTRGYTDLASEHIHAVPTVNLNKPQDKPTLSSSHRTSHVIWKPNGESIPRLPEGQRHLPAGTAIRFGQSTGNTEPGDEIAHNRYMGVQFPAGSNGNLNSRFYTLPEGQQTSQLIGENFTNPVQFTPQTVGLQGNFPVANIAAWRREPSGSMVLYRRDEEGQLLPAAIWHVRNGSVIRQEGLGGPAPPPAK